MDDRTFGSAAQTKGVPGAPASSAEEPGGGSAAATPKPRDSSSPSQFDRVYELLRGDLIAGLYAPREALREEALADHYESSRTPVRAALSRLVWERLLEHRLHAPTIVREITTRDIRQIYEMRRAVELFAVETAIDRIDRKQLEQLLVVSSLPHGGSTPDELPDNVSHHGVTPLHRLIVESLGNARLTDVLFTQSLPIARTQALYWRMAHPLVDSRDEERRVLALAEHAVIVQALLDRDTAAAREALSEHLRHGEAHLVELMTSVDLEEARPSEESKQRISRRLPNVLDHMLPGAPERT